MSAELRNERQLRQHLERENAGLHERVTRLEAGAATPRPTNADVARLRADLCDAMRRCTEQRAEHDRLMREEKGAYARLEAEAEAEREMHHQRVDELTRKLEKSTCDIFCVNLLISC